MRVRKRTYWNWNVYCGRRTLALRRRLYLPRIPQTTAKTKTTRWTTTTTPKIETGGCHMCFPAVVNCNDHLRWNEFAINSNKRNNCRNSNSTTTTMPLIDCDCDRHHHHYLMSQQWRKCCRHRRWSDFGILLFTIQNQHHCWWRAYIMIRFDNNGSDGIRTIQNFDDVFSLWHYFFALHWRGKMWNRKSCVRIICSHCH